MPRAPGPRLSLGVGVAEQPGADGRGWLHCLDGVAAGWGTTGSCGCSHRTGRRPRTGCGRAFAAGSSDGIASAVGSSRAGSELHRGVTTGEVSLI